MNDPQFVGPRGARASATWAQADRVQTGQTAEKIQTVWGDMYYVQAKFGLDIDWFSGLPQRASKAQLVFARL